MRGIGLNKAGPGITESSWDRRSRRKDIDHAECMKSDEHTKHVGSKVGGDRIWADKLRLFEEQLAKVVWRKHVQVDQ